MPVRVTSRVSHSSLVVRLNLIRLVIVDCRRVELRPVVNHHSPKGFGCLCLVKCPIDVPLRVRSKCPVDVPSNVRSFPAKMSHSLSLKCPIECPVLVSAVSTGLGRSEWLFGESALKLKNRGFRAWELFAKHLLKTTQSEPGLGLVRSNNYSEIYSVSSC